MRILSIFWPEFIEIRQCTCSRYQFIKSTAKTLAGYRALAQNIPFIPAMLKGHLSTRHSPFPVPITLLRFLQPT
jgi:hypothetical protein